MAPWKGFALGVAAAFGVSSLAVVIMAIVATRGNRKGAPLLQPTSIQLVAIGPDGVTTIQEPSTCRDGTEGEALFPGPISGGRWSPRLLGPKGEVILELPDVEFSDVPEGFCAVYSWRIHHEKGDNP